MTEHSLQHMNTSFAARLLPYASLFLTIALPILFALGGARLIMFPWFLSFEYTRPAFPADFYGFTIEDRLMYGPLGIEYMLNGEGISFLADQRLPASKCWNIAASESSCPMFNPAELIHMEDVKFVAQLVFTLGSILILIALLAVFLFWHLKAWIQLSKAIRRAGILTIAVIIALLIGAGLAWDLFFDLFHALLFEDGTWRFLYSDTLIRLYPEQFWFDAAVAIGLFSIITALICIFLSRIIASRNILDLNHAE